MPLPLQGVLALTIGGSGLELRDQLLRRLAAERSVRVTPKPSLVSTLFIGADFGSVQRHFSDRNSTRRVTGHSFEAPRRLSVLQHGLRSTDERT